MNVEKPLHYLLGLFHVHMNFSGDICMVKDSGIIAIFTGRNHLMDYTYH